VVNHFTRRGLDDPGRTPARPSQWRAWIARQKQPGKDWQHFAQECASEWRDFGQQPGTHLWLVRTGIGRRELRTAERQTVARLRKPVHGLAFGRALTISAGERTFAWKPGTRSLVDKTGVPILSIRGEHHDLSAGARITFPDRRWLQFPVRGTGRKNAIMTAMDQASDKVARYRRTGKLRAFPFRCPMEITVHPGHPLTDELVLASAISADWLSSYFVLEPSEAAKGGGGA
jgi:hypothetical protein